MQDEYLAHYGIKGQKWGRRRYQNKDGHRTPEGRRRENYYKESPEERRKDIRL